MTPWHPRFFDKRGLKSSRKSLFLRQKTSSSKGNDVSPENKQVFIISSQVSKRFFQLVKGSQLCSSWLDKILTTIKDRNSVANLQKK